MVRPERLTESVTLYEGDCLEVLPTLAPGSVDAVVTDPPYLTGETSITYEHAGGVAKRNTPTTTVGMPWGFPLDWVYDCRVLETKHWIVFANYKMLGRLLAEIEKYAVLTSIFAWRKSNAPNMTRPVPRLDCEFILWARSLDAGCGRMGEYKSLVIDVPMPQAGCMANERLTEAGSGKAAHPCQKPIAVVQPFIARLDAETILDPFAGTGTTAIAAMKEGRRCILIERDPAYCDIIRRRVREADGAGSSSLFREVVQRENLFAGAVT